MKYDINNLNDPDVKELLAALKIPIDPKLFEDNYQSICTDLKTGTQKWNDLVIDENNIIQYVFHLHRGRIGDSYSIHLRFKENNTHLIRLDIGKSHTNPDGTKIGPNHIHFNVSSDPYEKTIAYNLDKTDFPIVSTFIEAIDEFLSYTNVNIN